MEWDSPSQPLLPSGPAWVGEGCPSCKGQQFSPDCAKTLRKSFHLSELHISSEIENCAGLLQIHKVKSYIKWENAPWLRTWDMSSYLCPLVFCRGPNEWQAPSWCFLKAWTGFPGGASDKELACQCRRCKRLKFDPWVRKTPGQGYGNPLQYSCLENPMDRGTWRAIVHRVAKSRTWLKQLSIHAKAWTSR